MVPFIHSPPQITIEHRDRVEMCAAVATNFNTSANTNSDTQMGGGRRSSRWKHGDRDGDSTASGIY